jgi:hypothetical protein
VQGLAYAARDHHDARGHWPTHAELLAVDPTLPRRDLWQREFRYEHTPLGLVVRTAGIDGEWGTADDIASDPVLPKGSPAPAAAPVLARE